MTNSTARGHGKIANWGSVAVARIFDDTGFSSTPEDNCGAGLLTGRKFSPTRVRREIQRWVMPVAVYSPTGLRFTSRWQLQRRRRNESSSEYSTLQGSHCVSTFRRLRLRHLPMPPPLNVFMRWITAGPATTTKIAGKINSTSGIRSLTAVFCARSSARCRRFVRSASA